MNEHPTRMILQQLLLAPEALTAEEADGLTLHLETCVVCLETIEALLNDPVVERCRGVIRRMEEYRRVESLAEPVPPFPSQERTAEPLRFPGAPTPDAPLGTLGDYVLKSQAGSGSFGLVFRGHDQLLRREVAVKILRAEYAAHPVYRARFVTEARAAAGVLVFDHVVQVYDVKPEPTDDFAYPYLVMEWLEGQTLKARLRAAGGRLAHPEAARIAREVGLGLTEVHRNITAHRDLKPGNIMLLGDGGRAKIMDFGLALPADVSAEERLTQKGHLLGTLHYMSPEQARGDDVLDGRSDVFSLGVILYELLTGELPFKGKSDHELVTRIAAAEFQPLPPRRLLPALPRDLETIVLKCLAKDAAERYPTARAVTDDLGRWEEGRPILARPVPFWESGWKWARRHKAAALLLLFLFLTPLGIGGAGIFVSRHEAALRGQAERERDRARALEHAERVERARALARRGLWPEARQAYDEAWADQRDDADTLRVERLRCLFTHEERSQLPEELAYCDAKRDLADRDKALVLLHRGDYLLSDWGRQKESLKLVEQALAIPDGLAGADLAYAEGLAASTAARAIERYQTALRLDPFHHRANSALLTACLFLGRFDEAGARADFMRQVFHDDPLPAFAAAWAALLLGDRASCFRQLESIQGLVGEARANDLRAFFTLVADMLDLTDQIDIDDQLGLAFALAKVGMKVSALPAVTGRALEPFGFGVPTVTRLGDSLQTLNWAVLDFYWDRADAAVSKLEAANRTHADALLLYVQAISQVKRATQRLRKDRAAAVQLTAAARDLAYQAADAPTILPRGSYRYQARLTGLMLDNVLSLEPTALDPSRAARMRHHCDRLVEEGRRLPKARQKYLSLQIQKQVHDLECARYLVSAWLRDEPDSTVALRLHARLDLLTSDWTSALRHADCILNNLPNDAEMIKVRLDALAGLRKQLE